MTNGVRKVKKIKVVRTYDWTANLNEGQVDWLKSHTIGDLKDYAATLEYEGFDADECVDVIDEMIELSRELGYDCEDSYAYYDLLEFVGVEGLGAFA